MFGGFVILGNIINLIAQVRNSTRTPQDPDAAPTWRAYGQSGVVANGTASLLQQGTVSNVTNANPAQVTSSNSDVSTGTVVTISGVLGATGVNGTFAATFVDQNNFTVPVAAGGAYTSGGIWHTTGLYSIAIDTSSGGFDAGVTYTVLVSYSISGTQYTDEISFTVC